VKGCATIAEINPRNFQAEWCLWPRDLGETRSPVKASEVEETSRFCRWKSSGEGGLLTMIEWIDAIGKWMASSSAMECIGHSVAFLSAAVAVLFIDDWYKTMRRMRRETSVAALEALFALPDTRDCRQRRY